MALRSAVSGVAGLLIGLTLLASAGPASAALGRAYNSVDIDRLNLGATVASAFTGVYTVHTLTLPNHGVVKEFTRADGLVFAVVWRAPGRPDLRQILGDNFNTVQADNVGRSGRHVRRPIAVNRSNLVVQSGGHSGASWGAALIPQLQPAGFSASDLK